MFRGKLGQHLNTALLVWTSEDKTGQQPAALQEELKGDNNRTGQQTGHLCCVPCAASLPDPCHCPQCHHLQQLWGWETPLAQSLINYTFVLKGFGLFFFHKHMQHKSCLSPSHLTLFSLTPHLLSAKWVNSFSIYCGRIKPRLEQWEGCRTAVPCACCLPEGWALFATLAL